MLILQKKKKKFTLKIRKKNHTITLKEVEFELKGNLINELVVNLENLLWIQM